ncbi:MAG: hypothetical protein NC112_04420 [Oxalobacter formigenes]|nr:hypothetical protein [Oxalobacter formigenes]
MQILTESIRRAICRGWRVGIEENGCLAVFEVVARLGSHIKGDEKWAIYPAGNPREDGPPGQPPRLFANLDANSLVYCHSPSNGKEYIVAELINRYASRPDK